MIVVSSSIIITPAIIVSSSIVVAPAIIVSSSIIVAIAINPGKTPAFSLQERVDFAEQTLTGMTNVEVCGFEGLLVEVAKQKNANVIIRGLRAVSDFEHEFQLASMNRKMEPDVETLFLTPA